MWACAWMSEKRADTVGGFWGQDVFEPASLLGDFLFVFHLEGMREEHFRQAVAANDIFRATPSFFREDNHLLAMML